MVPGRLGDTGGLAGMPEVATLDKVQLFAKTSRLWHGPLSVALWESNAMVTGHRRPVGQILLEAKN